MEQQQFMALVRKQIKDMQDAAVPGVEAWVNNLPKLTNEQLIEIFRHAGYAEWRSASANAKHFLNTPDEMDDIREALAMEAYEEYQHFQGFKSVLAKLGFDYNPSEYKPVPAWKEYFDNIEFARDGMEKIAVENIGGEARSHVWLERVINGPNALLREIVPKNLEDEYGHAEVGLKLMEKYARDDAVQKRYLERAKRNQELAVQAQLQLNERLGLGK
ncbi:MAG: hypothetical protein HYU75_23260 [Betaproteobacteria bacterium]|nr:hypothetical protein [Betaproteobacteria bacterium]